jgi:hypothetical protein
MIGIEGRCRAVGLNFCPICSNGYRTVVRMGHRGRQPQGLIPIPLLELDIRGELRYVTDLPGSLVRERKCAKCLEGYYADIAIRTSRAFQIRSGILSAKRPFHFFRVHKQQKHLGTHIAACHIVETVKQFG